MSYNGAMAHLTNSMTKSNEPKGRGRPTGGKRSDNEWVKRTYLVERKTTLNVEHELLALKIKGIEVDRSELVSTLLSAWVKWREGGSIDAAMEEITPRT